MGAPFWPSCTGFGSHLGHFGTLLGAFGYVLGTIWEPLWALWGLHFRHDLGTRGAATSYEVEFRDLFFHASYKHTEASCRPQERSETAAEDVTASCTKSHQELPDVPYKDNTMIVHCIYIYESIYIYY